MNTPQPRTSESATPRDSVLLLSTQNFNWVGVRATFQAWPDVHLIEEVRHREPALRVAAQEQPDFIFVASDLVDIPVVPLIRELRTVSPTSQIIMIGKLLETEAQRQLVDIDLAAFLQWKCVTAERLRHVMEAVRDGEVRVASKAVLQLLLTSGGRRPPRGANIPVLTPKERAVLLDLAKGLTHHQIAEAQDVCERTIDDRVAVLKDKFGAPTPFMLGVRAERAIRQVPRRYFRGAWQCTDAFAMLSCTSSVCGTINGWLLRPRGFLPPRQFIGLPPELWSRTELGRGSHRWEHKTRPCTTRPLPRSRFASSPRDPCRGLLPR